MGRQYDADGQIARTISEQLAKALWKNIWPYVREDAGVVSHVYPSGDDNQFTSRFRDAIVKMYEFAYSLSLQLRQSRRTWKWIQLQKPQPSDTWVEIVHAEKENLTLSDIQSSDDIEIVFGAVTREDYVNNERIVIRKCEVCLVESIVYIYSQLSSS